MKAAIVAQWIVSEEDRNGYGEELRDKYLDYLRNKLDYDKIDMEGSGWGDYESGNDNGGDHLHIDVDMEEMEVLEQLDRLVKIILDDTKEIIDSDTPY